MTIGVHCGNEDSQSYSRKWIEKLQKSGIDVLCLNLLMPDALEKAMKCDGIMCLWEHTPFDKQSARMILYVIENYLHKPVFPDTATAWHYDEKVAQYYLLSSLNASMPETWIFWDIEYALKWTDSVQFPVVFKLSSGAGSSNVLKVKNKKHAIELINKSFRYGIFPYTMNEYKNQTIIPLTTNLMKQTIFRIKDSISYILFGDFPRLRPTWWKPELGYIYFQEFLNNNQYDTRISIIGNRAFGFRRFNRSEDFRASGSGNIDYDPAKIDQRCISEAFKLSKLGRFQSMAYDFLFKNDKPVVCEISYAFADWAVHNCHGFWDDTLTWHETDIWPEDAQVEDFISFVSNNK